MFQAIETHYVGPTNFRGSRVVAKAQAGKITVEWDDALGVDENHAKAARAFAVKHKWRGRWVGGALADGRGNVYVRVSDHADACFEVTS